MARRFDAHRPLWAGGSDLLPLFDDQWLRGLYSAPDRVRVVSRLQRELDRLDRDVSRYLTEHLAVLDVTGRTRQRPIDASDVQAERRRFEARHFTALKRSGGLGAELARSLSGAASEHPLWLTASSAFPDFSADVERALTALPQ